MLSLQPQNDLPGTYYKYPEHPCMPASGEGPLVEVLPNGQTVDDVMEEIAGGTSVGLSEPSS